MSKKIFDVLIVEDERIISIMLSRMVERLGHRVCACVPSTLAAMDCLSRMRPDIVFIDIQLEGEPDGIAIGTYLDEEMKVPFVYASAYTDEETRLRAMATSPLAFISKPLGIEAFISAFDAMAK